MRPAELGTTGSFVPGVAYHMDESGTRIRDEATRAAEEEQTAGLLEIDEENGDDRDCGLRDRDRMSQPRRKGQRSDNSQSGMISENDRITC